MLQQPTLICLHMAAMPEIIEKTAVRTSDGWSSWLAGFREVLPITLSAAPFGVVCGVGAVESGMSHAQAFMFSFAIFAGSSQIIATEFIASGAPTLIIVLAALAVNLRFLMYSASISPFFAGRRLLSKLVISYLLTDQAFALSINAFNDPRRNVSRLAYYFGAALGLLLAFQLGNMVGVTMGSTLPPELGLEFCVPLVFLALMIPALKHRSMYVSAAVAAVVTIALLKLPYLLGVFIAALVGILAGYFHMEAGKRHA